MPFDNSDANICCRCYGKEKSGQEREGRKIGGKKYRGKRKKKNVEPNDTLSHPGHRKPIQAQSRSTSSTSSTCAVPEVLRPPMKTPIHPSFHPIFNSVCPFHNRYIEFFSIVLLPIISICFTLLACQQHRAYCVVGINVEILCRPRNKQFITKASDIIRQCRKIQTGLARYSLR